MRIANLFAPIVITCFAAQALAEEQAPAVAPTATAGRTFLYSATPEGKTLPAGVARVRLPYQIANGSTAFDKDGGKSDSIVKYSATGSAMVLEYGISEKVTFQMKTDFVLNQKVTMNTGSKAYRSQKSALYSAKLATLASATAVAITDQASLESAVKTAFIGGCVKAGTGTAAACSASYADGTLTSASASAVGLASSFGAGSASVKASTYAAAAAAATDSAITSGISAAGESTGGRGLGDTVVGALYEAYQADPIFFSIGGGLRLPTGNRNLRGNEGATTRAAYELGLRFNLDYLPVEWFMLSWQNQSEVGIAGTKHKEDSVEVASKRDGVRNVGFVYLKPSLTVLSSALDSVKTCVGVTYDYDSAQIETVSGSKTGGLHAQQSWLEASLGYSLLGMGIPAQLDIDYESPFKGKNVTVAVAKTTATLKAFARF
jgi:hypothetical protein